MTETPPYLDVELLSDTIQSINQVWKNWGTDPSPSITGRMAALLYEKFLRSGGEVDQETVEEYLKMVG